MDALRNTIALQQRQQPTWRKILSNMASQAASTSEATQAALAAILARLEVGLDCPETTTAANPLRTLDLPDAVKRRPTHSQLVERQPDFRKAGAAAWLRIETRDFSPCTQCTESGALFGSRLIYASGFPYAKPGDLRKAMQGARIVPVHLDATIVKSFQAWIPRSEAADKDKIAAISSFAVKTVTTIQRSPEVKARNFFRSLLASIGGKTLEAATA
ncbi:hypothetical protein BASA81_018125 [Batrachochytrium salamandrivorans]|nr:hypothetical protein BASA81_018125 [Batrachochytrium salamandrivorans]